MSEGFKNILTENERTFLIWDDEGEPPTGDWITVLWSDYPYSSSSDFISIPELVEKQAQTLRARYLNWIFQLGEIKIKGKKVVEHMIVRPGLSYWWMTLMSQKFNASENSQINNAIKALVLEQVVSEYQPVEIFFISKNRKLIKTFKLFTKKLDIRFKWELVRDRSKNKFRLSGIYEILPYPIKALITFLWNILKSFSISRNEQNNISHDGEISFIDILVHLNKRAFTSGSFKSNYWTKLVDKLKQSKVKTNWFHNYFYQEKIPTPTKALKLLERFNSNDSKYQHHSLLENNLSGDILFKTMKDYCYLLLISFKLSPVNFHFKPSNSSLDFWPLFKDEWYASLRGSTAVVNCMRVSLYEKSLSSIPFQKKGVYIQENQPWEMALIYAWKKAKHGTLIGVPHTTVRYWDMRYFYDSRSYKHTEQNFLPTPNLVAVNGPVAKNSYLEGGYPASNIVEVEALRYLHLGKHCSKNNKTKKTNSTLTVLVCGDFLSSTSEKMLSWLVIAADSLPSGTKYFFKPHPAYPLNTEKFPTLSLHITEANFTELFDVCDVVFTSNITSASVDAYYSGIHVIQMLDGFSFNMSPLRGLKGGEYVRNPNELIKSLNNYKIREHMGPEPYFYLDDELPRWNELLGI